VYSTVPVPLICASGRLAEALPVLPELSDSKFKLAADADAQANAVDSRIVAARKWVMENDST